MKQITIVSGKGGSGKTTLSSSLATLLPDLAIADCDVDAANLNLIFGAEKKETRKYSGGKKASINSDTCIQCGECLKSCRFDAIHLKDGRYQVDNYGCEGCGMCQLICPANAVTLEDAEAGEYYIGEWNSSPLIFAHLFPGEETSGGLVAAVRDTVKEEAENKEKQNVLIDGAPGIGCPATSSITGADLALVVTEPSVSGKHDMLRMLETIRHFKIKSAVVINKWDINPETAEDIRQYCEKNEIPVLGRIPFDQFVVEAVLTGKSLMDFSESGGAQAVLEISHELKELLKQL